MSDYEKVIIKINGVEADFYKDSLKMSFFKKTVEIDLSLKMNKENLNICYDVLDSNEDNHFDVSVYFDKNDEDEGFVIESLSLAECNINLKEIKFYLEGEYRGIDNDK
jgi:hypothetical protein